MRKTWMAILVLAGGAEEPLEGLDGSLFAQPEQMGDADIDPIDESQVAFDVLDFIDADGVDLTKRVVFQTQGDESN